MVTKMCTKETDGEPTIDNRSPFRVHRTDSYNGGDSTTNVVDDLLGHLSSRPVW